MKTLRLSWVRLNPVLFVVLGLLLCVFTFFVPPFEKPDEQIHFYRVITLFAGQFSCDYSTGRPHFSVPLSVFNFPKTMGVGDIATTSIKFPISLYKQSYPWIHDKQTDTSDTHCTLPWYAYIPQLMATAVTYPFNNLLLTFYGMRFMNAILFFLCMVLVQLVIPRIYKNMFWLFAFIPMVLHQVTAVSYDAPSLALGMVMAAYFLSLVSRPRVTLRSIIYFIGLVTLFNAVKAGYYPTFLLIIPVALKATIRWNRTSVLAMLGAGLLVLAVAVQQFFKLQLWQFYSMSTLLTGRQITLSDPLYFMRVIGNTVFEDSDALLHQIIGQFGWLDYSVSPYVFAGYLVAIGSILAALVRDIREIMRWWLIALLWIILLTTFIMIAFTFYTQATPPAYYKVVSFQGRYFLPIFPIILFTVAQSLAFMKERRLGRMIGIVILMGLFTISLTRSIYGRYYDYSKSIINYNPLIEQIHADPGMVNTWETVTIDRVTKFVLPTDISIGTKISGFQFVPVNEFDVTAPYAYAVADATCTKIYAKGYIDHLRGIYLKHIRYPDDPVYTQYFPITKVTSGAVCLMIRPTVLITKRVTPLKIYTDKDKPVIRLLYLIQ